MNAANSDKGICRNQRGSAAVELAVALPFLVMLIAGGFEYSRGFAMQVDFEQSAQRAAELALVRPPAAATTTALAFIKTEAATAAGVEESGVTVELYRECNDVRQNAYPIVCPVNQRVADYVNVEVRGTYERMIDFKAFRGEHNDDPPIILGEANVRLR